MRQSQKLEWHTEQRLIKSLIPFERNPRKISDKQKSDLKKSLLKFNLADIPVINTDDKIISGHQRIKILLELGRGNEQIDVRVPNRTLTKTEFEEYNIRANKNTAEFDSDLLVGFDEGLLKDIGFDSIEIDDIFQSDPDPKDDEVPEPPDKPKSKTGDLFQLGDHRLLCADCYVKENVNKLTDGEKIDLVLTDPPYGIDLDTDYSVMVSKTKKGQKGQKFNKVIGDDKPFDYRQFEWLNCKEQFWWGGDYYTKTLPDDGCWFVWDKRITENFDKMYGSCFEICWSKRKHRKEIIRVKWANCFGTETQDIKKRIHPTQKPLEVSNYFINKFSKRGNIVLDLFGGSGSTLIACEKLNRRCYMLEIDPMYIDVIIDRWQNFTGKAAIKL